MKHLIRNCQNYNYVTQSYKLLLARYSNAYEAEGKTSVTILNKEVGARLMVDSLSEVGFRLNNGINIIGPCILFARSILSWNVKNFESVNDDSLCLIPMLSPKLDIFVLGYGQRSNKTDELEKKLIEFSRKSNISFEMLPTEDACTTFNFLNSEKRCVAAALLPVEKVKFYNDDDVLKSIASKKKDIFDFKESLM